MSTQVKQDDYSSDGEEDDVNKEMEKAESSEHKNKQKYKAYKKNQQSSKKKGAYGPPAIANPLLKSLDEDNVPEDDKNDSLW